MCSSILFHHILSCQVWLYYKKVSLQVKGKLVNLLVFFLSYILMIRLFCIMVTEFTCYCFFDIVILKIYYIVRVL
ncbi:hypothetical protein CS535_09195 [Yersinia massiliensis]|nr:hypothetical protein CS535_09195 [Yersinia massiliensis]